MSFHENATLTPHFLRIHIRRLFRTFHREWKMTTGIVAGLLFLHSMR